MAATEIQLLVTVRVPGPEAPDPSFVSAALAEALPAPAVVTVTPVPTDEISLVWSVGDVQTQCGALTDDEAMRVLRYIERHHDCTVGVTWQTVEDAIAQLYPEKAGSPGRDDDEDADDPFVVEAEARSDDYNVRAVFEAVEWFEQASDDEIRALAKSYWGGDYSADAVAEFYRGKDDEVDRLFGYLAIIRNDPSKKDCRGFECAVYQDDAMAWLKDHRPALYQELLADQTPDPAPQE